MDLVASLPDKCPKCESDGVAAQVSHHEFSIYADMMGIETPLKMANRKGKLFATPSFLSCPPWVCRNCGHMWDSEEAYEEWETYTRKPSPAYLCKHCGICGRDRDSSFNRKHGKEPTESDIKQLNLVKCDGCWYWYPS